MLPKRVLARPSGSAGTVSERSDLETLSVLQEQTLNAASLDDVQRESLSTEKPVPTSETF